MDHSNNETVIGGGGARRFSCRRQVACICPKCLHCWLYLLNTVIRLLDLVSMTLEGMCSQCQHPLCHKMCLLH